MIIRAIFCSVNINSVKLSNLKYKISAPDRDADIFIAGNCQTTHFAYFIALIYNIYNR